MVRDDCGRSKHAVTSRPRAVTSRARAGHVIYLKPIPYAQSVRHSRDHDSLGRKLSDVLWFLLSSDCLSSFFLTIWEGVTAGRDSEVLGEIVCRVRGTIGFNQGCRRASSGVHLTAGSHSRHFFKKSINCGSSVCSLDWRSLLPILRFLFDVCSFGQ